jgi:glycosyltransferase involved in cell wall biosynthesis
MGKHIAVMGIKGLPAKGGGERVAESIILKALKADYRITIYGKESYCEDCDIVNRVELIKIRDMRGKHLNAFFYGLFFAFHALLLRNYDLIHLHYADFGFIVPLLRLRFKVMGTSHGAEYERDKWGKFAKLFFKISEIPFIKFSHLVTSVSRSLAEYYRDKYHKNIVYIPNGVDLDPDGECAGEINNRYNLCKNGYILFAAGRIIPSKGCDILLKSYNKLNLQLPLVIIGDIESDQSYKEYLVSLAGPNVLFIDFIKSKKELFRIVKYCKLFVFPSTYEAMSMMLLEVGLLKRPIICSDIIQNVDAIGDNAIYFKSGDTNSLAEKMEYALHHEKEIMKITEAACDWIRFNRNAEEIAGRYLKLYEEMCSAMGNG